MRAFILNLEAAADRWSAVTDRFARTKIEPVRVPAIQGANLSLPIPEFDGRRFHRLHGRATNLREIGCYLSHVAAMRAFLETDDAHGLICEDDIVPRANLEAVLASATGHARHWNVLRVTGLGDGVPVRVRALCGDAHLCISLGRVKGAGAYVVDRTAARAFVDRLLPMWLPFDHAVDREWWFGLRAAYVLPYPCSQTEAGFRSSIQTGKTGRTKSRRRWLTTYPYQAANEITRWLCRGASCARAQLSRRSPSA